MTLTLAILSMLLALFNLSQVPMLDPQHSNMNMDISTISFWLKSWTYIGVWQEDPG